MPEPRVICYIQAFDCEHTVEAAMESVRGQTYDNWLCFVLSNGNQNTVSAPNASFDVIKSVAARDPRFIVLNRRKNMVGIFAETLYHLANRFPNSYICALDADDEYQSDFFQRGVALAEAHNLDIVACGTEIIQKGRAGDQEGTLLRRRQAAKDLIIPKEEFTRLFPVYKTFFNETWGKLYRTSLFLKEPFMRHLKKTVGGKFLPDTKFVLDLLSRSRAVGVLSGTSHKFFQYQRRPATNATLLANAASAEKQARLPGKMRFSVYATHEAVMGFLREHGEIDEALYEYTQAVLFGWFGDYYTRTLLPIQNEKTVALLAARLVFHPKFNELMLYQDTGKYNNLRGYRQRIEFCQRLKYMLIAQKALRNRRILWKNNVFCSRATQQKINRIVAELEKTIQALSVFKGEDGM